ncbi:hypothetical protein QOZ80_2AG0108760 [Eleusine coracana subsp. coracana]|nr:hypothetical protein QOZ80_2AG0108760 [Eleusine coracana subsp. coracana]
MSLLLLEMKPRTGVAAASSSSSSADGEISNGNKLSSNVDDNNEPIPELPLHLIEQILCCISPLESARFATVCKSWSAIISDRLAAAFAGPHLFVWGTPETDPTLRGTIVSVPLDGSTVVSGVLPTTATVPCRVRWRDTDGLLCISATPSGSLLAFADWWSSAVVLVNPLTGATRRVDLGEPSQRHVLASCGGDGDAFVSSMDDHHTQLVLNWKEPVDDGWTARTVASWSDGSWAHATIASAARRGDRFYALHKDGRVATVDAAAPPPLRMELLPKPAGNKRVGGYHLIESTDGEVLLVRRLLADGWAQCFLCEQGRSVHNAAVVGFEVYALDAPEGRRWSKVERLAGGRALFVGSDSAFAVEAVGCRSNCVYFFGKNGDCKACKADTRNTLGVYSLEHRKVLFDHVLDESIARASIMWILPSVVS